MTHSQLEVLLAKSVVAVDEANELRSLLAPLTDVATEVPEPSAELQALLHEGVSLGHQGRRLPLDGRRRRRGAVAGAVVLALSGVGAAGLSAAANILPSPLQHQVSKFSEDLLPFRLPEPAPRHTRHAPDAAQAPKPGSVLRGHVRVARRAWLCADPLARPLAPSDQRCRPERARPRTPGPCSRWAACSSRRTRSHAKPEPTASRPGDEPPPGPVDSEVNTSSGSEPRPANELKQEGAMDELRGPPAPPVDQPSPPPGRLPDRQDKNVGKHDDPGTAEQACPTDKQEQPGKGLSGGGQVTPDRDTRSQDLGDAGTDAGHQDAGPPGDSGDSEPGPDLGEAWPRSGAVDVMLMGHTRA
jgi:hypothetical protein